jgi:dihydrodipicolinate synthase/N-acetylneuraminate lyase
MTVRITVPVLTLRDAHGRIAPTANAEYAARAARTWLDHFMVNGTIGGGETSTPDERRTLLEIWAQHLPASRLLACCWTPEDLAHAADVGITPIAVLQNHPDDAALLSFLATLPPGAWVYSHPKYSPVTFTHAVATHARREGCLPAGGKICKVSLDDVTQLRQATGKRFGLYDGRCRHLARSVQAGATGIIAVPLSPLPVDLPERDDIDGVQDVINRVQAIIDTLPRLRDRNDMLTERLRSPAGESPGARTIPERTSAP